MPKNKLWYKCVKCGISGVRLYTERECFNDESRVQHKKGMDLLCYRHITLGVGYAMVYPKGWEPAWLDTYPDAIMPFPWHDMNNPEWQFLTDTRQVRRRKRCAYHANNLKKSIDRDMLSFKLHGILSATKWRRYKCGRELIQADIFSNVSNASASSRRWRVFGGVSILPIARHKHVRRYRAHTLGQLMEARQDEARLRAGDA